MLGCEIYSTFFVPNLTLGVILAVSVVLVAIGIMSRGTSQSTA